jgi:hypothetical protein
MAAAVAGVWYGKLDPVTGLTVLGIGLSIAGMSAKANRHQAELLTALQGVAAVGAAARTSGPGQAVQLAENQVLATAPAAMELVQGLAPVEPAAVHLSADGLRDLVVASIKTFQERGYVGGEPK